MEESKGSNISWFEQVKIQTEILMPVLPALRHELGEKEANRIVYSALREWMKQIYTDMSDEIEGSPLEKWQKINEEIELPPIKHEMYFPRQIPLAFSPKGVSI